MNRISLYILSLLSLITWNCKREVTDPKSPFTIQTNLNTGANQILKCFALPDNTFLVFTHDRSQSLTTIYKFSDKLLLLKKKVISGHTYSYPVIDNDNNIVMIGDYYEGIPGFTAVKMETDLQILETRNVNFLYAFTSVDAIYHTYLTRLSNGIFVVANTYENYPKDKIVMFGVKDLFKDNKVLWRVNPANYTTEWVDGLFNDTYGNFYVTAIDHLNNTRNMVLKYNSNGQFLHRNDDFWHTHNNLHLLVENDVVIYHDYQGFHKMDTQLKKLNVYPSDQTLKSNLFKRGEDYFYTSTLFNSDGLFMEINKTDQAFNIKQKRQYGNRGTNIGSDYVRFLIQLTSGDMVAIEMVENPDLTGNYWLLQKFDKELNLDE